MARWTGTALLCVTLLQGLRMTTTLPNGAPLSACEDMMPQHSGVMPQPGPAPYTIQVSNSSYETGVPVTGKQSQRPGLGFPSLDALHPTRWAFSFLDTQASHVYSVRFPSYLLDTFLSFVRSVQCNSFLVLVTVAMLLFFSSTL
ncbi:UNVERIFIED_CONTAM: hypothetical protein FKN15_037903 [Acipenser sinensis]